MKIYLQVTTGGSWTAVSFAASQPGALSLVLMHLVFLPVTWGENRPLKPREVVRVLGSLSKLEADAVLGTLKLELRH